MTEAVVVAIITGCLSLFGIIYSANRSSKNVDAKLDLQQAVMEERLNELTREVRTHNNFASRVPVVEKEIEMMNKRVKDLESYHKGG